MISSQRPPVSALEGYLITIGVIVSPLWFITPIGVNLTPTDFLVALGGCMYILRTQEYPLLPSKLVNMGFLLFIFISVINLTNTPESAIISSTLGIGQYIIIFFIIIPFVYAASKNAKLRYSMLVGIFLVLVGLILATTLTWIAGTNINRIYLWYGGNQQVFWLVASGGLVGIGIFATNNYSWPIRLGGLFIFVLAAFLVTRTTMITSMLLLFSGSWLLLVASSIKSESKLYYKLVISGSIVAGVVGLVGSIHYWSTLLNLGNIESRFLQYTAAVDLTRQYFPLGSGLQSGEFLLESKVPSSTSTSIHSLYFSFLLELGIIGIVAFLMYILAWVRFVLIPLLRVAKLPAIYLAPTMIFFGLMIISFVYYPPVRRFWWVLFAISWAIATE